MKKHIKSLKFISILLISFFLLSCDEAQVKQTIKTQNGTQFKDKDTTQMIVGIEGIKDEVQIKKTIETQNITKFGKDDTMNLVVGIEVLEHEALLPVKLNKSMIEGLLSNNDFQPINTILLKKLLKIIEPLPSIQLTPQEKSINYERLHPHEEENPKEIHFSKSYLQRANLDADSEKEILLYIGRNEDDKGDILLIDKKENDYYIVNKIKKRGRVSRETQEPFFQVNTQNQIFTINHNTSWGGGMSSIDEYITSFYKVINNEVKNCLDIPHESWAIYSFDSKSYSLSSKYFFKGKDTIQVVYDYEFSVCAIELLLEKYPKLKNTSIAKEEQIVMLEDRDTVNYIWQKDENRYKAVFLPHNKLNQEKLNSFTEEADISYKKAFQEGFESIKQKGNKIQKLFLKHVPDFYNTK